MRKRLKVDLYMPRTLPDHTRSAETSKPQAGKPFRAGRYTHQRLVGGCVVYWLGRGELYDGRTT